MWHEKSPISIFHMYMICQPINAAQHTYRVKVSVSVEFKEALKCARGACLPSAVSKRMSTMVMPSRLFMLSAFE